MQQLHVALAAAILAFITKSGSAIEHPATELDVSFNVKVQPFFKQFCFECHQKTLSEGKLDLTKFSSVASIADAMRTWDVVLQRIEAGEMPPEEAKEHPASDQSRSIVEWIRALRRRESLRTAGDPGPVVARRLSNSEYNYTIRDLTGQDIQPAREFPVDPANEAGFDNSSESLSMSPELLVKYLGAARTVVEHLVLQPEGFAFAPHPVVTDTDRDKYCVARIIDFYKRQPTDYADYFLACWKYQHRAAWNTPAATLAEIAAANSLSPKYLAIVWETLTDKTDEVGPIAKLRKSWRDLPVPTASPSSATSLVALARQKCERLRDWVSQLRSRLEPKFENLKVNQVHDGSQTMVLWKNRQYAVHRRKGDMSRLRVVGETRGLEETVSQSSERGWHPSPNEVPPQPTDRDLLVPAASAERAAFEAAFKRFCSSFPDAFYVSERGRDYVGKPKAEQEKGRLLSAGFHSMMGYFRDDLPLMELILNEGQQQQLDRLWQELDFVANAPIRQYTGFVWFERAESRYFREEEFDFARSEDKDVTSEAKIQRLSKVYLDKATRVGGHAAGLEAIDDFFKGINASIRWIEQARLDSQPSHLKAIVEFAERAFRRPLAQAERDDLLGYYQSMRATAGESHEEAIQDAIVYVLMSPQFCYRMDLASSDGTSRALTDYELANRLSYFLWSSMPDRELLAVAASGRLRQSEELIQQARRMLRDKRARGLVVEFGGNWLEFRRFEEHNSVDRGRFRNFTDELRAAMFEEPIQFFENLIHENRSVLDFLYAKHTFVNLVLAKHYGLTQHEFAGDEWIMVANADRLGRGGLLPMSVFLTQNSPGLRTSPVKRGYWVTRRLLGERIPPPPPNVPELPGDEAKFGELTLRETLARHRDHKSCAGCHNRFDSIGLVFEDFGPIGERRNVDLGGRPVDTKAHFPDGSEGNGLVGLQAYLHKRRQQDFLDNLGRKLLSYGLGRSLQLSDSPTLEAMQLKLAADGYRFDSLIETIITSPQFLNKRGREPLEKELP